MDCSLPGSPSTGFSRQECGATAFSKMSWGQSFHQVYLLHFIRGPSHGTLTFITSSSSTVNIWIFCAYLSDVPYHKVRGGTSKCIFRLGRILLIQCSANFNLIGFYGLRMLNSVNNTDYKSKYISSSGQKMKSTLGTFATWSTYWQVSHLKGIRKGFCSHHQGIKWVKLGFTFYF